MVVWASIFALLSACGWQLDTGSSARLRDSVSVIASKTVGIERELELQLGLVPGRGSKNSDADDEPGLRLFVANEVMHRRISAIDQRGLAGERELTLSVEVEARELNQSGEEASMGAKTFSAVRRYVVDQRTVLATESEQASLAAEMRRELASRILDWLVMVANDATTNPSPVANDEDS